jgi:hypothetical protein
MVFTPLCVTVGAGRYNQKAASHAVTLYAGFQTILVLWQLEQTYSVSFVVSSLWLIRVPHRGQVVIWVLLYRDGYPLCRMKWSGTHVGIGSVTGRRVSDGVLQLNCRY